MSEISVDDLLMRASSAAQAGTDGLKTYMYTAVVQCMHVHYDNRVSSAKGLPNSNGRQQCAFSANTLQDHYIWLLLSPVGYPAHANASRNPWHVNIAGIAAGYLTSLCFE